MPCASPYPLSWSNIDSIGGGPADGWYQRFPPTPIAYVLDGRIWLDATLIPIGGGLPTIYRKTPFDMALRTIMRVAWTAHVPNTIPPQVIQPYQEGATLHRVDLLSGGGVATGFAWVEFGYRPGTSFGGGNPGPYYRWNIGGGFHEIYPSSPSHRFEVIIQLGPVKVSTPSPSGPIETREFGSFLFVDGVLQDSYRADTLYDAILRQHFCNAAVSVKQFAGVIPPVYPFPNPARISAMKYSVE